MRISGSGSPISGRPVASGAAIGVDPSRGSACVVSPGTSAESVDSTAGSLVGVLGSTSETSEVEVQAASARPKPTTIACHRCALTLITPAGYCPYAAYVDLPPPTTSTNSLPHPSAGVTNAAAIGGPLHVRGLTKNYGIVKALDELTLDVPAGACYGLVGPNGSGKSTMMRAVVGLVRPDAGTIEVCGTRVDDDVLAVRRATGVMLDPLQLFDRLSAWEFVETIGALRLLEPDTIRERSAELFTLLDLTDDAERPIAGYSHGMRKKTALAAALLSRPQLLMLDEPFEGVDPVSTRAMRSMLDRFRAGGGTVVLSTHVMDIVERVCDHVGVINRGRLVAAGPIDDFRDGRRLEDAFIDVVGARDVDESALDWLG